MPRIALALLLSAGLVQSGKETIYMDFMGPPPTLTAFVQGSVAVVHVTVKSTSLPQADRRASQQRPRAVRFQVLTVVEVLKADSAKPIGSEIVVKQYGGTLVVNGGEISTAYPMPVFNVGDEMVLILERGADDYVVMAAEAGAFKIDAASREARVPQGVRDHMPAYQQRQTVPASELLTTLRALGKDGKDLSRTRRQP